MATKTKEKNPLQLTENGMALVEVLRAVGDECTAAEIAEKMGKTPQQVNGAATALQKRDILTRVEAEVVVGEDEDAKTKTVKYLVLTDFGKSAEFFVDAPEAE